MAKLRREKNDRNMTPPNQELNIRILAVRAHVDQRKARALALRFYGDNMLVVFPADFEFDVAAVISFAG
jgi:hypothetical protein